MEIASKGHFFTQIPQPEKGADLVSVTSYIFLTEALLATLRHSPIQRGSEMNASLLFGPTSIQSFPSLTTGHDFLHS